MFELMPWPQSTGYQPGVCNIGPAEISRRRRAGHAGLIVTLGLYAVLLLVGGPRALRLLVALPAAGAAVGYLQAYLHFCAGFGSRGVFNFGDLGTTHETGDAAAKSADRRRSLQIALLGAGIGLAAGVAAVLLPLG